MHKKGFTLLLGTVLGFFGSLHSEGQASHSTGQESPSYVTFSPPKGWRSVDSRDLPKSVKFMVVGTGSQTFPPSINLGTESYGGTLKDYLNMIKEINTSQGASWKDLGKIETAAGNASLSQVDAETEWGDIRMMHVILIKDGTAYILTTAALKEEFPKFYKDFFASMRSLNFVQNPTDLITNVEKKDELLNMQKQLEKLWLDFTSRHNVNLTNPSDRIAAFESPEFQNEAWIPFQKRFTNNFASFGDEWQKRYLDESKQHLVKQ